MESLTHVSLHDWFWQKLVAYLYLYCQPHSKQRRLTKNDSLETKTHQRQESRQAPLFVSSNIVSPDCAPRASSDHTKERTIVRSNFKFRTITNHKNREQYASLVFDDPVRTRTSNSYSRVLSSPSPPFTVAVARSHKCKRNLLHKFHFKLMSPQTALQLTEKIWSGQVVHCVYTSPYRTVVQPARPTGDCPEAAPYYRWHSMHVQVAGRRG